MARKVENEYYYENHDVLDEQDKIVYNICEAHEVNNANENPHIHTVQRARYVWAPITLGGQVIGHYKVGYIDAEHTTASTRRSAFAQIVHVTQTEPNIAERIIAGLMCPMRGTCKETCIPPKSPEACAQRQ